MPDQDVRLQHLKVWLDEQLANLFADQGWGAVPPATLTAASSDASFRRYFRWEGEGRSFVVMDAPPPQENCKPFVDIAFLLAKSGINVPKIYAEDLERGFLLLNDLGNKTYLDVIDGENADALFDEALQALLAFQQLPMVAPLPSYDVALLRRELELFPEWYVGRELGLTFSEAQIMAWVSPIFWPFLRVLAVFTSAPIFSSRSVPLRTKVGLAPLHAHHHGREQRAGDGGGEQQQVAGLHGGTPHG